MYKALEPKDTDNDKVFLVMGPWHHGQVIHDGSTLGALRFDANTALQFRREVLAPFLAQYLKDGAPKADVAAGDRVRDRDEHVAPAAVAGPRAARRGCSVKPSPLYLSRGPASEPQRARECGGADATFDEYVSDPAKPVPFISPSRPGEPATAGADWLVDDQREASGRPDVLVFVSDALTAPVKISGQPVANLVASTSGTDSDWVVKLIDVYPDEVADQPEMGGYQLMVSADIFRGRYRESLETAKPIAAGQPLLYRFALPTANHVFLPGHRIMVQVQSSWFPLYDRNPQTFVPNIFWAKPEDYRTAVQRVYHAAGQGELRRAARRRGPLGARDRSRARTHGTTPGQPRLSAGGSPASSVTRRCSPRCSSSPPARCTGRGDGFSWPSCSPCALWGTVVVFRAQPELLAERARPVIQRGQPVADRVLLIAFMATYAALVAFAALDARRLRLLPPPPSAVSGSGLILFAAGWIVVALALRENAFAIAVVRYQEERGHAVVSTGPYRFVRHPLYSGLSAVMIGMSLWLGSVAAAVASAVPIGILAARIRPGGAAALAKPVRATAEYAARVRSRLVPGIW